MLGKIQSSFYRPNYFDMSLSKLLCKLVIYMENYAELILLMQHFLASLSRINNTTKLV